MSEMQMARTVEPGWFNLAIGEPAFLQDELRLLYPETYPVRPFDLQYPPSAGLSDLLEEDLLPNPLGYHYAVVTVGAKQALAAAMYALREVRGAGIATAAGPYWPSFPTLARQAGLSWWPEGLAPNHAIEIVTYPNNPTGLDTESQASFSSPNKNYPIWDAVYASRVYGFEPQDLDRASSRFEAVIGSASKGYGLSGLRLGWAHFRDQALAAKAAEFVELTTSGASTISQRYFASLRRKEEYGIECWELVFQKARETLKLHGNIFESTMKSHCHLIQGAPAGQGGMFAWFVPKDFEKFAAAAGRAKVKLLDGVAMGAKPGWLRASLGVKTGDLVRALHHLETELSK